MQGLEADIAGKLAHFCQVIETIQTHSNQAKTGNEWVTFLVKLLDDVFALEEEEERVGRLIRDQLQAWLEQLEDAGFVEPIGLSIVREHFKNKLGGEQVSQRFLAGQVNFCTLMPMRSIPFSVVCLLGMNDGVYPRSVAPLGFDLMASRARPGDRSRRDDDRYLFLEAIHSAQSRLYISFMHRSIKDNSEKVPSVLVSELLNYCTQGYCLAGDEGLPAAKSADNLLEHLCHENPMVPFSPNAFLSRYPSYAAEWLPAAKGEGQSALPFIDEHGLPSDPDFMVSVLELDDLQRFWRAPVKFFFNHRLKVFFDNQETVIDENEPFELDHLQRYLIRDDLLKHLLQHGDSEASKEKFSKIKQASGQLPHGDFGVQALEKEYGDIHLQYEKVLPYLVDKRQALEVNLTLSTSKGSVQLQGWLSERYREGQIFYRPGNVSGKYLLAATINHLCQNAMGESLPTHYLGIKEEILFEPVEQARAIEQLTDFVEQYLAGIDQPFQYFPNTVYAGYQASLNKDGEWVDDERGTEKALKAMRETFYGNYLKTGEVKDPYIGRVWQRLEEEEFLALRALGKSIFTPDSFGCAMPHAWHSYSIILKLMMPCIISFG